jgi:hypothetical protein
VGRPEPVPLEGGEDDRMTGSGRDWFWGLPVDVLTDKKNDEENG